MSKILNQITLDLDQELEEHLKWMEPDLSSFQILRQSIDSRRGRPKFIYSVEVFGQGEKAEKALIQLDKIHKHSIEPITIIGAGPAGLFAALRLLERGIPCRLLEQGEPTEKRITSIARYWRSGELNPRSNVGFGEGGAGLFSDGKLITRIKSPHIPYVMQRLVQFGAPKEIEYLSNPHVGSDKIRRVIPKMRKALIEMGLDIRFNTKVTGLKFSANKNVIGVELEAGEVIPTDRIILATGHSSDIFEHLKDQGIFLEGKSFAFGLRIEHPQELINKIQYREFSEHPKLKSANYKLAHTTEGVGVYSFCMCPGGYVLSSGTEADGMVSNGMSNFNRNSPFANAAIVVSLDHAKNFGSDLFGGMKFRRELEKRAFQLVVEANGFKELPAQNLYDFMEETVSEVPKTSSPSGAVATPLHSLFDSNFKSHFNVAIQKFNNQMKGFSNPSAVLMGVESRTSCPIRVTRGENLESISHSGLYPCGEGAGYAGGITSAACDGVRIADQIFENIRNLKMI